MGFFENQIRLDAGFESSALIGIAVNQIVTHPLNDLHWHLGSRRIIQVNSWLSLIGQSQSGELGPDGFKIVIHEFCWKLK